MCENRGGDEPVAIATFLTRSAARASAKGRNARCQIPPPTGVRRADDDDQGPPPGPLAARFADRDGFFLETVELPAELPPLTCPARVASAPARRAPRGS